MLLCPPDIFTVLDWHSGTREGSAFVALGDSDTTSVLHGCMHGVVV